jgi:hypothetical protein
MTDPVKTASDPESHALIEIEPPERLARWAKELSVPSEALVSAVQKVGPRVDKVKDYLTGGQAGDQQGG